MSQKQSASADDIDLTRLFGLLFDHKWLIISITGLFAVIGVAYALLATPIYQSDALVQVERRSTINPLGDMAGLFGEETDNRTAAEVQILRSRMVLGQVVDREDLDTVVAPKTLPVVGNFIQRKGIERPEFMHQDYGAPEFLRGALAVLPEFLQGRSAVWGGEDISLGRFEVANHLRDVPMTLRVGEEGRYELFFDKDPVTEQKRRRLGEGQVGELASFENGNVQLRVAELQAAPGAEFSLIKRSRPEAIRDLSERLSVVEVGETRNSSTGILRLTLTGPDRDEILRSLDAVAEIFLRQNVERQSAETEQSLAFLEEQAPELRDQLATAEDNLNQYRIEQDSVDLNSEAQAAVQQFIEIESRLNDLEFQEAQLSQRYTTSHPSYQSLLRQKQILLNERAELNARVNEFPAAQQEVIRRTRDVEVTQAIYVNVLNKMQELQVARAGTVGNVRIIDQALVAGFPIAPNKSLVVIIATLLGGMVSVGIVLIKGILNRGVETPEQIEEAGIPVYATVPLSDEQKKLIKRVKHRKDRKGHEVATGVLADRAPADTSVEALRSLRTSLHFAMLEASDNRLMISGPSPSIGKSFVSANLGAVCAQAGQRVLIVDADMRKGHLHHVFKKSSEKGLSELLSGRLALHEVIRESGIPGLSFVPRGTTPPNPSELLMTHTFSHFLEDISKQFDLVIIDTPPILAVTDAAVVGAQCGTTLMVARFQLNPVRELQMAKRRLETGGVVVRGAILNAVERKAVTRYGYGYYNYAYQ